jgi:hypothetical protein
MTAIFQLRKFLSGFKKNQNLPEISELYRIIAQDCNVMTQKAIKQH